MALLDHTASGLSRRERELRREISHLREKLADLTHSVSDMGRGVYADASTDAHHAFKDLRRRMRRARPAMQRREREIVQLAQAYPFTVVTAVAGVGLIAAALVAWSMERHN